MLYGLSRKALLASKTKRGSYSMVCFALNLEWAGLSRLARYMHPYEAEITSYSYPKAVYTHATPTMYKPFDSTSATFVDTPEAVRSMLAELKTASYIAVDLEHHDARSYVGIVCLMQISTREKDWIVDTLKPWREDLQILNEVFTDPRVLKVSSQRHVTVG